MDSDEKKPGAGSGGGGGCPVGPLPSPAPAQNPANHNDIRFVDGTFARSADQVTLFAFPGKTDGRQSSLELTAGGPLGHVGVYGTLSVIIRTGRQSVESGWEPPTPDESQIPEDLSGGNGIVLYAPGQDTIRIRRGSEGNVDCSQEIVLTQDGNIHVCPGMRGNLYLNASMGNIYLTSGGGSSIELTPQGITIKGTLVQIN
ncbi:MAG TPA: hypothetical protein VNY30_02005 [Bryobacteraceae bacterium]|jgi:hypothetical protein|nr:hypothetical protein [Bryobacteraceae bacterium]